jgi:hypothetical protein
MNKALIAIKCKDGWVVKIEETHIVKTETDVRKLMKAYNLKQIEKFSTENRIYAEV